MYTLNSETLEHEMLHQAMYHVAEHCFSKLMYNVD